MAQTHPVTQVQVLGGSHFSFQQVSLPNRNSAEEGSWTGDSLVIAAGPQVAVLLFTSLLCSLFSCPLHLVSAPSAQLHGSTGGLLSPPSLKRLDPSSPHLAQTMAVACSHFTIKIGQGYTQACPVGYPACHTDFPAGTAGSSMMRIYQPCQGNSASSLCGPLSTRGQTAQYWLQLFIQCSSYCAQHCKARKQEGARGRLNVTWPLPHQDTLTPRVNLVLKTLPGCHPPWICKTDTMGLSVVLVLSLHSSLLQ